MPALTIREVLAGEFNDWQEAANGEIKLCQKRINLQEGYKYTVKNIQIFNDKGGILACAAAGSTPTLLEVTYVTPYPIVLNDETVGITLDARSMAICSAVHWFLSFPNLCVSDV